MKNFDPQKEGILCSVCAVLISEPDVVLSYYDNWEILTVIKAPGEPVVCKTCLALKRILEPDPPEPEDEPIRKGARCMSCGDRFFYERLRHTRGGRAPEKCPKCKEIQRININKIAREKYASDKSESTQDLEDGILNMIGGDPWS